MVTLMDKAKKRCFNHFWYRFQRQKIRILAHLSKFKFYLLEESSVSLGRLSCTTPTLKKRGGPENLGLTSLLGIIPHLLQVDFDLLFLAYLIHVFRISELFCKAIKPGLEDKQGFDFEFYMLLFCNKTLSLIYQPASFFLLLLSDLLLSMSMLMSGISSFVSV
jgi:hypothetical protein